MTTKINWEPCLFQIYLNLTFSFTSFFHRRCSYFCPIFKSPFFLILFFTFIELEVFKVENYWISSGVSYTQIFTIFREARYDLPIDTTFNFPCYNHPWLSCDLNLRTDTGGKQFFFCELYWLLKTQIVWVWSLDCRCRLNFNEII